MNVERYTFVNFACLMHAIASNLLKEMHFQNIYIFAELTIVLTPAIVRQAKLSMQCIRHGAQCCSCYTGLHLLLEVTTKESLS